LFQLIRKSAQLDAVTTPFDNLAASELLCAKNPLDGEIPEIQKNANHPWK